VGRCPGEGLNELLGGPRGGGMLGDPHVDNASTMMGQQHEDEKDASGQGRHREEVHRHQGRQVIRQERAPGLRWALLTSPQQSRNGSLRDVDAELLQFPVDSRGAPQRICHAHRFDERPNSRPDPWATGKGVRGASRPSASKPLPMPVDHRLGLHDHQIRAPIRPGLGEQDPRQPIACGVEAA
jgi:hypothetical protein